MQKTRGACLSSWAVRSAVARFLVATTLAQVVSNDVMGTELTSEIEVADRMRSIYRLCAMGRRFKEKVAPAACGKLESAMSWREVVASFLQLPYDDEGRPEYGDTKSERKVIALFSLERNPVNVASDNALARVQAVIGPGTFFEATADGSLNLPSLSSITDDDPISNAIIFVAVYQPEAKWDEQDDFVVPGRGQELSDEQFESLGVGPYAFNVTFADGEVWLISRSVPKDVLSRFFYVKDARRLDREQQLKDYAVDRLRPLNELPAVPVDRLPKRG